MATMEIKVFTDVQTSFFNYSNGIDPKRSYIKTSIIIIFAVIFIAGFVGSLFDKGNSKDNFSTHINYSTPVNNKPEIRTSSPVTVDNNIVELPSSPKTDETTTNVPKNLIGIIVDKDFTYVQQALAFGYSLGEQRDTVRWTRNKKSYGTVVQTGSGQDSVGCRQFKVSNKSKGNKSGYIDVCANGAIR